MRFAVKDKHTKHQQQETQFYRSPRQLPITSSQPTWASSALFHGEQSRKGADHTSGQQLASPLG